MCFVGVALKGTWRGGGVAFSLSPAGFSMLLLSASLPLILPEITACVGSLAVRNRKLPCQVSLDKHSSRMKLWSHCSVLMVCPDTVLELLFYQSLRVIPLFSFNRLDRGKSERERKRFVCYDCVHIGTHHPA